MNKSKNRHMNVFHAYTQNDNRPIENNISRGFAILLQECPALLILLLNRIQKGISDADICIPIPENEYIVDFQVEASDFPSDTSYVIGVTLTADELEEDSILADESTTNKQFTDISIIYDDVLIIIEVKRTNENCIRQVQRQMKRFRESLEESMQDSIVFTNNPVNLTWQDIYALLLQYRRMKDLNGGRLVEDYMDYLARNYPSWIPVQQLNNLTIHQTEQINARLDMVKNEYAKRYLADDCGLIGGRRAIPIDEAFVKQCNLSFDPGFIASDGNKTECITVGMWPSDTGGQYWKFKKIHPQKNPFFRSRFSEIHVNDKTIPVRILPYIKFSHVMGKGIQWLYMRADTVDNHFDEWLSLSDSITGKRNKGTKEWDSLICSIQEKEFLFEADDLYSFVRDFQHNFANKGYVFVSCGLEIKAFLPFVEAQKVDKEFGAFASTLNSVIQALLKAVRSEN